MTGGPTATRPAKEATVTIPIVMAADFDPVRNGFVASLARPGGNITGLSTLAPELSGKQVELVKEIVPKISRVAGHREFDRTGQPKDASVRPVLSRHPFLLRSRLCLATRSRTIVASKTAALSKPTALLVCSARSPR